MRFVNSVGYVSLAALAGLVLACDDSDEDSCRGLDRAEGALFGARTDAGGEDGDGVVGLLLPIGARGTELCSGALIAPNVVLTARHCLGPDPDPTPDPDPDSNRRARAHIGMSLQTAERTLPIVQFIVNDERDLALAVLDRPGDEVEDQHLLPLALGDEIAAGDRATLAGFGVDEDGNTGVRRFVEEPIVEVDDELVVVDGAGETGACTGDSGGPLLLRAPSGQLRVAGILSVGSASCIGIDVYQRVAPVADWLNEQLEQIELERQQELAPSGC